MKPQIEVPKKYIKHFDINGMRGRMLHFPKKDAKYTIVYVHGQHTSVERVYLMGRYLSRYGEVIMPDLPGFGGMDSFYKIGKEPSYDNYAEYLYTFCKSFKLDKNVVFLGASLGSQYLTRMYQKHPDAVNWTKHAISFVGFGRSTDFHVSKKFKILLYPVLVLGSWRPTSKLIEWFFLNKPAIQLATQYFARKNIKKYPDKNPEDIWKNERMEGYLWWLNDDRTHARTAWMFFHSDLTQYTKNKIPLTMINLTSTGDQYFDNKRVEKSFKMLYKGYKSYNLKLESHTPSVVMTEEDMDKIIPKEVKKLLKS